MTHGEAWYKATRYDKLNLANAFNAPSNLPKKMTREEAGKYYNDKLFDYWLTQMSNGISKKRKTSALKYLIYRKI